MDERLKKLIRTLQSELPFLKNLKEEFRFHLDRSLRHPHEEDFKALALIPDADGCYLDIGANHGQSILAIAIFKPDARIVSFEANPLLAAKLTRRYEGNPKVTVIAKGLSDRPGSLPLYVPSYKGFLYDALASLDRDAAASWISDRTVFRFDPASLSVAEVPCEVATLDDYALAPVFIKVDVQGYEYNVLRGALQTLRRYEPVVLVEAFRSDPRTVALCDELGYEEYDFDGLTLRKGPSNRSPNSFLITPGRFATLHSELAAWR